MNSLTEPLRETASAVFTWLTQPLFNVGEATFSATSVLKLLVYLIVLVWASRLCRQILISKVFPRFRIETGFAHALANLCTLLEAADKVEGMLKYPAPQVRLTGFGDSSIDFELLVWTQQMLHNRGEFISRVNFEIHAALEAHGIAIPFPQRDLHLRSAIPLPVESAGPDRS